MRIRRQHYLIYGLFGLFLLSICSWTAYTETPDELNVKIDNLIKQLGDDDWPTREQATQELIQIGDAALEPIRKALTHSDPEVRMRANLIFKALKWGVSPALKEKIGNLMEHYDNATQEEKQTVLIKLSQQNILAAPVFLRLLIYEPDETIREKVYNIILTYLDNPDFFRQLSSFSAAHTHTPPEEADYWLDRLQGDGYTRKPDSPAALKYYERAYAARPTDKAMVETLEFLYFRTKQWDKGISFYEGLIKRTGATAAYYVKTGMLYYYKGDKNTARNTWESLFSRPNLNVQADDFYQLGAFYESQADIAEAIKVYERSLKIFPDDTALRWRLAAAYQRGGDYDKAIILFGDVLNKIPPLPNLNVLEILNDLGECYLAKNDRVHARETWWKMVEVSPDKIQPLFFDTLIQVLESNNLTDDVIKAYQTALQAFPGNNYRIGLSRVYYWHHDIKPAINTILDAFPAEKNPDFKGLAEVFRDIALVDPANSKSAVELIKERLTKTPDIGLKILLARSFESLNDKDNVTATVREILKETDKFGEWEYQETGQLLFNAQSYDEATALYLKMLDFYQGKHLDCAVVYEALGNCYLAGGDKNKARETWFKITAGLKSQNAADYANQGKVFLNHQMYAEARETYQKVLKMTVDQPSLLNAYQSLGRIAIIEDNLKEAVNEYLQAKNLATTEADQNRLDDYLVTLVLTGPGLPNESTSTPKGAEEVSAQLNREISRLNQTQQSAPFLLTLVRVYSALGGQGRIKDALDNLKTLSKITPDNKDLPYLTALLYQQDNQLEPAAEIYRNLIKNESDNVLAAYLLSKVYEKQGKPKEAEATLKTAQETSRMALAEENLKWGTYLKQMNFDDMARYEMEEVTKKTTSDSIDNANACEVLSSFLLNEGQYEKALDYFQRERKVFSREQVILMMNLETFYSENYYTLSPLQKTSYAESGLEYLRAKLADRNNQPDQAVTSLQRALEIYPANAGALEELVNKFNQKKLPEAEFKRLTNAAICYQQAKINEDPASSYYYATLAETYRLLGGKTDEALALITKALQIEPGVLDYYVTAAELYLQKNDPSRARAIARMLVNLRPNQKLYQELLAKIPDKDKK